MLGLYGSALRIESDLERAEVVIKEAREIARALDLPAVEPGLLLRMAYLELEREHPTTALRWAQEATLASASTLVRIDPLLLAKTGPPRLSHRRTGNWP